MTVQQPDAMRAGTRLIGLETESWVAAGDIARRAAIVIHGFTADSTYMRRLADYIERHGYFSALFEYNSYLGIDAAAALLCERLQRIRAPLQEHGFVIIAHSMGGLVARQAARTVRASLAGLRGLVLLGTPNNGTVRGPGKKLVLSYMLDAAEAVSIPNPFARLPICRSALQLTCSDDYSFIETLNTADRNDPHQIPMLSISGGLEYLEFGAQGGNRMLNGIKNAVLQSLINESPNDGLVPESSSNVSAVLSSLEALRHRNDYAEYLSTNHTYLDQNQSVADLVVEWIQALWPST
jgi:pimeloyl-ACP methyl ester carboxylesterase